MFYRVRQIFSSGNTVFRPGQVVENPPWPNLRSMIATMMVVPVEVDATAAKAAGLHEPPHLAPVLSGVPPQERPPLASAPVVSDPASDSYPAPGAGGKMRGGKK